MTLYMDGTQNLSVETAEKYSFRDDTVYASRYIEGKFTDAYTFDGILRIDYSDINKDDRKYQQVLEEAGITEENIKESGNEKFWITDANIAQYIEEYEIPETFTMKLDISN
ncbi:MAG: hypothetical protein K2H91_02220, partial [Lachnospiraceae bacterium]|nr:hypothetical protein [Lachnospiraceae bacterium]